LSPRATLSTKLIRGGGGEITALKRKKPYHREHREHRDNAEHYSRNDEKTENLFFVLNDVTTQSLRLKPEKLFRSYICIICAICVSKQFP
jgi:hypothetical protein